MAGSSTGIDGESVSLFLSLSLSISLSLSLSLSQSVLLYKSDVYSYVFMTN